MFYKIPLSLLSLAILHVTAQESIELEEITVNAFTGSFSAKSGEKMQDTVNLGLLGLQDAFLAPVNVVNYDEKLITQQAPRTLVDMLAKNDPSVRQFGGETNTLQGIYVRGFQLDSRQFSLNGLTGLYGFQNTPVSGISSAQIIKGASAATTGMSAEGSIGSAVNIQTKRAFDNEKQKIGVGIFEKNRKQITYDFGKRFGDKNEYGLRASGLHRSGDTKRVGYDERTNEFNLGFDYRGERLSIGLDLMHADRLTNGGRARLQDMHKETNFPNVVLPEAPKGRVNLVPNYLWQKTKDDTVALTFNYFADDVEFFGGIGKAKGTYHGYFNNITGIDADLIYKSRNASYWNLSLNTTSLNFGARGKFYTGDFSHNWNISFDHSNRKRNNNQSINSMKVAKDSNLYNPQFLPLPDNYYTLPNKMRNTADQTFQMSGIAFSDTIGIADDSIKLTLGARLQQIKQKDHQSKNTLKNNNKDSLLSPMFTAVYQPTDDLVFYGNYMEDLLPGILVGDDSTYYTLLKPQKAKQIEIGVRKDWEKLVTSANIYQINSNNAVDDSSNPNASYDGKLRNRGIELSVYGSLLNNTLRPSIGASWVQYEFKNVLKKPDFNGKQQVSSPKFIAKAGIDYDLPRIKNLTFRANAQHYGKSFQNPENTRTIKGYTIYDFGIRYETKIAGTQAMIAASLENAFNKNYWQVQKGRADRSFALVGMPRTGWLKIDFEF